ncbi:MAG: glycoside hydrolase family 9 protein [Bacteroidales bacterium]|nr:glycoside hydrolase family 9 protein [Bacteroidales bacterium]
MKRIFLSALLALLATVVYGQQFKLNDSGYFTCGGVDAMLFNDYYPEGHQGGVSVIMHGKRVFTNGDIRFDETPGQWQPVPKKLSSSQEGGSLVTRLAYPDSSRHATGFNPMFYPDVQLTYSVTLTPKGKGLEVVVDLDQPIPEKFIGKAGFNLEIFPGWVFGKPYLMDGKSGIYPQQANGPVKEGTSYTDNLGDFYIKGRPYSDFDGFNALTDYSPFTADRIVAEPYAVGHRFTSRPDDPYMRFTITSETAPLKLYDGRMNHNTGWFVLRSEIPSGATKGAVKWFIEPNVVEDWRYKPVVQVSQVGYMPSQQKVAVIELDRRDSVLPSAKLVKFTDNGEEIVKTVAVRKWDGNFLRYTYAKADFTDVKEPGAYVLRYGGSESPVFQIAGDVYDRGVWQPVIEYFLPVQMCHMRVAEKYRVWHDVCHMDDAKMAAVGNYIDGYVQLEGDGSALPVGKNSHLLSNGGWHDAGDFDLRIESQLGESYILTRAWEAFHPDIDVTSIDFDKHVTEIHQPDGKNDFLQQIENGALTAVNGYLALGRLYRGIICRNLRQYVMLGDASAMTDNIPGTADDRWVFTYGHGRDLSSATSLAAVSRALKGHNDTLSVHCLDIARTIFEGTAADERNAGGMINLAIELYRTTGDRKYFDFVMSRWDQVVSGARRDPSSTAAFAKSLEGDKKYRKQFAAYREALLEYRDQLSRQTAETPYGVPYRPDIWGAGWTIQRFGYNHYFLVDAFPDIFSAEPLVNAMNFVLGCHPGSNQQSFASGVGSESATVGYGLNRADWSYIPGGVVSGTALIRPDFPELLVWPYLWQQVEYVLGGGSSHYMFLVLASRKLLSE